MAKVIKFKPVRNKSKDRVLNRVTKNLFRIIFLFLLLTIIFYELYYLIIDTSYFEIKKITVKGNTSIPTKNILKIANIYPGMKIYELDKEAVRKRIETIVLINKAYIHYEAFGEISIDIQQRVPFSIVYDGKIFYEIDDTGTILKTGLKTIDDSLTIITGIHPDTDVLPGDKLKSEKLTLALNIIKKLGQDSLSDISEINVENKKKVYFFSLNGIKIFPGEIDNFKKIYPLVLKKILSLNRNSRKLEYIDFRAGDEIVYKYSG